MSRAGPHARASSVLTTSGVLPRSKHRITRCATSLTDNTTPDDVRGRAARTAKMAETTMTWTCSRRIVLAALAAAILSGQRNALAQSDALPSWNDGADKQSIVHFVGARDGPGRRRISSPRQNASPCSTTTARCGPSSRSTSSSPSRSTGSRRWRRSIRNGKQSSRSRRCSTATCRRSPPLAKKACLRSWPRRMPA